VSAKKPGEWPLTHQEFEEWVASSPWQDAVTKPMNPHQYTLKRRSPDPRMFELACLHIREFGSQEYFGGSEYSYYEAAGSKFWTMMNPLEWTVLVNRKELPSERAEHERTDEEEQPNMSEKLPEVYTSRFLAKDVLASGIVVPVRVSMYPPEPLLGELPYTLKHTVRDLIPERTMHGDWRKFSPLFWKKLEHVGPEKIVAQLAAIGAQHDGKPLALLCFEDLLKGQRCHRVIISAWWQERTDRRIPELTPDGELLGLDQLHHQVQPMRPR
jgi:hypothetical protein